MGVRVASAALMAEGQGCWTPERESERERREGERDLSTSPEGSQKINPEIPPSSKNTHTHYF